MSFDSLEISLIVFTVSALAQAAWMIAVGRVLQFNGKRGAARAGVWLAGLCLCLLLPLYAIASAEDTFGRRLEVLRASPVEFFLLAALPALILTSASSFGWGSGRWGFGDRGDPAPIFCCGLIFTTVATIGVWVGMLDMHGVRYGAPVDAGFAIVPCALWHLFTGPWLMRWAQGTKRSNGVCLKCDYDLAGLPDGAPCPECGTARSTWPDPPQPSQTANATVIQSHSEPAHSPPNPDSM